MKTFNTLFIMESSSPPLATMRRAITEKDDGKPQLVDIPMPRLGPDQVHIKPVAMGLNPSDFKMGTAFPRPGAVIGQDMAGTIIAAGENAPFTPGDLVWGGASGCISSNPEYGSFSTHVCAPALLVRRLDPQIDPVEASTLSTALATSALAFWTPDALDLTPITPENPSKDPFKVLVYGGSTASGTIAIQLLRLCGLDPIATCSPHNFDLVRSYGASAIFDYADPATPAAIKAHTGGQLKHVLDCISDAHSVETCFSAMARVGGRYVSLEVVPEELLARRRAVRACFVSAYGIAGDAMDLPGAYGMEADPSKREMGKWAFDMFERLVNTRKIRTHPVERLEGGLAAIIPGLAKLQSGSVSGKKLVAIM
ncbi:unnamed protein product [Clonostachys rhizophaga]|uniref:Enoyl reductase (ER) domain-containing protein n=1 Tax=Clonostachys rhizophaga TaxID=160324 RepID=A0A9N9W0D3_9HYPO|nr:unnamed protein product [Clonostachys rhizophaga]